jgi:hypothetical protein
MHWDALETTLQKKDERKQIEQYSKVKHDISLWRQRGSPIQLPW